MWFKFRHDHYWEVEQRSNALQLDDMGYPLRLCICKCTKCGRYDQQWLDTSEESAIKELDLGESFLIKWKHR